MKGIIKKKTEKGFGFIGAEGQAKDLFFHSKSVVGDVIFDDMREGETVTFDIEQTPKGPSAVNVQIAPGGDAPVNL
ncbi:cold shock domain-containing protein [Patescibacteria group bacterium]|nr:cold shock domain-containing protein [Patescibacteria group bacterium]